VAGGYTYRADKGDVRVTHAGDRDKEEHDIDESATVMPGDIIRVPERFFLGRNSPLNIDSNIHLPQVIVQSGGYMQPFAQNMDLKARPSCCAAAPG